MGRSSPDFGEGLGGCLGTCLRRGRTGFVMAALRGRSASWVSLSLSGSAHHPSAFLWGSTPFLCARAKKWGGTGRASAVYCLIKRRTRNRARQGGLVIVLCACAPLRWVVVVAPCCHSTPFLWCLPKETVSSRQRKALFYPGGSTIRVSATALWTIRSSPDLGRGLARVVVERPRRRSAGGVLFTLCVCRASGCRSACSGRA